MFRNARSEREPPERPQRQDRGLAFADVELGLIREYLGPPVTRSNDR